MARRSSNTAMTKSGARSAFTSPVRAWLATEGTGRPARPQHPAERQAGAGLIAYYIMFALNVDFRGCQTTIQRHRTLV